MLQRFGNSQIWPVVVGILLRHHRQLSERTRIQASFSITLGNQKPRLRLHLHEQLLLLVLIVIHALLDQLDGLEALVDCLVESSCFEELLGLFLGFLRLAELELKALHYSDDENEN
jgi:hypothetical protein